MDFFLNKIDKFWDNLAIFDEKVKDLKRKREELNALKEDTESRRSTELQHPRKKLKKQVELWFENVEKINGEIIELEQKIGESSNAVSRGLLSGNVLKKIADVEELLQQGKFQDGLVVADPGRIGQALSTTTLFGGAAEICMREIWAYLIDDEVNKIGVYGMGGVGKTTIMKLIHNHLLEEREKFNIVIWITVSKEMNITNLQNKIARAMNQTLDEDEDETTRAGRIYALLARTGKYVLILDDLWDKFSLEDVGIPEPSNGSKLLVTTRLLDVCRHLDCQQVKVPTLSEPDAWSLFSEKVGREVLRHRDLLPIVKLVAEECAGLPLAIVIIASSMKGVCNVHEWRNALDVLRRHVQSVNKMEEKVFQQLQFSYDRLRDEKVEHCFLCCALYPEDYEIGEKVLIELWIAEGLVEEMDSMQMEIDMGHTILNKLKNSCLIENGNRGGVKVHDVVRDMALRITSVRPRFLVRAGMELSEIPNMQHWKEDLEKVSLMMTLSWSLQIPHQTPAPKCPNLTTLLLSCCGIHSIPEGFFDQMKGLKILDLSNNDIKILPNSIFNLETLTTLLLHHCGKLKNVPSFSKLKALKKLELGCTFIEDIPDGLEKLVNLKYLDLSGTRIREMDDGILTKLTSLQFLKLIDLEKYIDEGISSVRGEEIGGLRKLEMFDVRFDGLNELNSYNQALQLARNSWPRAYRILVGPAALEEYEDFSGWDKLIGIYGGDEICSTNDGIKIPSDVQKLCIQNIIFGLCEEEAALMLSRFIIPVSVPLDSFSSLFEIDIYKCRNIKKLFSSHWVLHNLQNLEYVWVRDCDELEEIIASELEEGITTACASASFKFTTTLPKLKILKLWDLPELKSICGENGVMVSCDSIEEIEILDCPKLKRMSLNLPLQDDGQPYPPPPLIKIQISSEEWWSQLEWDHPNAKSLLEPYLEEVATGYFY